MTIERKGWKIISNKDGYQIQRLLSSGRWVTESYHPELGQAVESLFKHRIRTKTNEFTINALDTSPTGYSMVKQLVEGMEAIANEVAEAVQNAN